MLKTVVVAGLIGLAAAGCVYRRSEQFMEIPPQLRAQAGANGYAWGNWAISTNQRIAAEALILNSGYVFNPRAEEFYRARQRLALQVDAGRLSPDEFDRAQREELEKFRAAILP